MKASVKAIHHCEQEHEKLNSSQLGQRKILIDNVKIQYQCPYQKKPHSYEGNYLISIFIVLLIASTAVFAYKYFQNTQKQKGIQQQQAFQNRLEELEYQKIMKLVQNNKALQKQIQALQMTKSQQNENLKYPLAQSQNQYTVNLQNKQQHMIQQQNLNLQKSIEPQITDINKQQQNQILDDNPVTQAFQQQQDIQTNQNQQQLYPIQKQQIKDIINQPNQQTNIQLNIQNNPPNNIQPSIIQNNKEIKSQQIIQNNINQIQNSQKIVKQDGIIKQNINEIQNIPQKINIQTISQMDLLDPIIKVRKQMETKFNSKFQDLIYIKSGTNITEQQYYHAKDRMNLWKYINPKTKKVEFLDEVNYQDSHSIVNSQNTQFSLQNIQKTILKQQLQYQKKYSVSHYQQIPFCVIIPSFKNADKYFRNLNSIMQQNYQQFHIIYIDDASKDGTAEKVQSYLKKYDISQDKITFIQNKVNKRALSNIDYAARKLCKSGQIMTIIDGDDYLIGTQVFKIINARYQSQNLLALYTNHIRVHQPLYLKVGTCIDYPKRIKLMRTYRHFSIFPASHLRTFYVDLYWRINLRDLRDYKGDYFTAANDFAIMMPILQMAGQRFEYLPQLTYLYDAGTGYNNFQTKTQTQAKNFKITKRRRRYPKISHELQFQKRFKQKSQKVQKSKKHQNIK